MSEPSLRDAVEKNHINNQITQIAGELIAIGTGKLQDQEDVSTMKVKINGDRLESILIIMYGENQAQLLAQTNFDTFFGLPDGPDGCDKDHNDIPVMAKFSKFKSLMTSLPNEAHVPADIFSPVFENFELKQHLSTALSKLEQKLCQHIIGHCLGYVLDKLGSEFTDLNEMWRIREVIVVCKSALKTYGQKLGAPLPLITNGNPGVVDENL